MQDTPQVKITYSAKVAVQPGYVAKMSAIEQDGLQGMDGQTSFAFAQKIAVPTYVIALVVANLETKKVGNRVNVITEPEQMAEVSD